MASKPKNKSTIKKPRTFALDIFEVLRHADENDLSYYENLTDEQKKAIAPRVLMRWMSSVSSDDPNVEEYHIIAVNDVVNVGFWQLSKFPDLQWKLLAAVGAGIKQRHEWIKGPTGTHTTKLDDLLIELDPSINNLELDIAKSKFTQQKLEQLCRGLAMDDAEIKPIIEEFKKYKANKN